MQRQRNDSPRALWRRRGRGAAALLALACAALGSTTTAQVPGQVNYQGYLTDDEGLALTTGSYCLEFGIFDGAYDGATRVWGPEQHDGVEVLDGYFNVVLGASLPLEGIFVDPQRFIGLSVGDDCQNLGTEVLPRQQVLSAPFALTAGDLVGEVTTTSGGGIGRMTLSGANGSDNLRLGANGSSDGRIEIAGSDGAAKVDLFSSGGQGYGHFYGSNGALNAALGPYFSNEGALQLYNSAGSARVRLYSGSDIGREYLYGADGGFNIYQGYSASVDDGYIGVYGPNSALRASMFSTSGGGRVYVYGPNGNLNVKITHMADNNNHGSITVQDAAGTNQAGMYVNSSGDGRIYADSKSFVVDHPQQPGKKIVYISAEAPEAAIFVRGRVTVEKGTATIELPEHFTALIAEETLTVNLTPHSLASKGVAVVSAAKDRVEIGELFDGTGTFEVSYVVQATRADLLDHKPVLTEQEFNVEFGIDDGDDPRPVLDDRPSEGQDDSPVDVQQVSQNVGGVQ